MGSPFSQKQFSRRQVERSHNSDKTASACAEFNALFQSADLHETRRREAETQARHAEARLRQAEVQARHARMQARNDAIAEVRMQVERYAFQEAELGFGASA